MKLVRIDLVKMAKALPKLPRGEEHFHRVDETGKVPREYRQIGGYKYKKKMYRMVAARLGRFYEVKPDPNQKKGLLHIHEDDAAAAEKHFEEVFAQEKAKENMAKLKAAPPRQTTFLDPDLASMYVKIDSMRDDINAIMTHFKIKGASA